LNNADDCAKVKEKALKSVPGTFNYRYLALVSSIPIAGQVGSASFAAYHLGSMVAEEIDELQFPGVSDIKIFTIEPIALMVLPKGI
jgi:hypothetical protein